MSPPAPAEGRVGRPLWTSAARRLAPREAWEREATFEVRDLSCRACARRAEGALRRVRGVRAARVGFAAEMAQVVFDARATSEHEIATAMQDRGFQLAPASGLGAPGALRMHRATFTITLLVLANLLALSAAERDGWIGRDVGIAKCALAAVILGLGGVPLARRAAALVRRGRLGGDALALAGAALAFVAGVLELVLAAPGAAEAHPLLASLGLQPELWASQRALGFELAGLVVALALCVHQAYGAVRQRALAWMAGARAARPDAGGGATLLRLGAGGAEQPVRASALRTGDRVRLRAGERAPVAMWLETDARASERAHAGAHAVQRDRRAGEILPAGALLLSGPATARVAALPHDHLEDAIDAEVHRALALTDRHGAGFLETASRALCVAALAFAAFALLVHGLLGGLLTPAAALAPIAVLVGCSPAAFWLAAPAARALAIARARAAGIVVKDPAALERAAAVDAACFEKSGTLTTGEPRVANVFWVRPPDRALLEEVLALEERAAHPAGRAVAAFLRASGVLPAASGVDGPAHEAPGGIAGRVRGQLVELGAPARWGDPPAPEAPPSASLAWFGRNGEPYGYFEIHDAVRSGAEPTLRALRERGIGAHLLTGDRREAAKTVGHRLGVMVFGGLSPADKALHVRDLQHAGARVLFVGAGDGAAQADVSVALAPGVLPGAVPASLVLTGSRLEPLAYLVDLSRALRSRLREGAAVAIVYNAVLLPCAALGWCSPAAAAALSLVQTLAVLANAFRLPDPPFRGAAASAPRALPAYARPALAQGTVVT